MMMGGIKPGDIWDIGKQEQEAMGLFDLNKIRNEALMEAFLNAESFDAEKMEGFRRIKKRARLNAEDEDMAYVSSDEADAYESNRMDEMYERYRKNRMIMNDKEKRKSAKESVKMDDDDFDDENFDDGFGPKTQKEMVINADLVVSDTDDDSLSGMETDSTMSGEENTMDTVRAFKEIDFENERIKKEKYEERMKTEVDTFMNDGDGDNDGNGDDVESEQITESTEKRVRFADDTKPGSPIKVEGASDSMESDDELGVNEAVEEVEADPDEVMANVIEEMQKNDDKGAGLLIPEAPDKELEFKSTSKMEKAQRWFADRIFDEVETNDTIEQKQMVKELGPEMIAGADGDDEQSDGEFEVVEGPDAERRRKRKEAKRKKEEEEGEKVCDSVIDENTE